MSGVESLKRALARISDERGQVYGLGLLLSPQTVLTCAHVVSKALPPGPEELAAPAGAVRVDLPYQKNARAVSATVVRDGGWHPAKGADELDLALLELSEPLPFQDGVDISFAVTFGTKQEFQTFGASEGHQKELIPIWGRLRGEIANGRCLLDVRESNYKIHPGCSGAPAIDPRSGLIVGLVAQKELNPAAEAGFLISAKQLRRAFGPLGRAAVFSDPDPLGLVRSWAKKRYCYLLKRRDDVLRFIDSYRSKPGEPKPFVGRARVLQQLDEWLSQKERGFLLVSGAAGRGKSALLLHWLTTVLRRNPKTTIFYIPIRISFDIADEKSGLELLFAAFCDAFGEMQDDFPRQPTLDDYSQEIAKVWGYMRSHPEEEFLLVVDGLDEAVNQWFVRRRILPVDLPSNLHVLISARHKPGEADGTAWLADLHISDYGCNAYEREASSWLLEVATLDKGAMAEAVVQLGHPLDRLAKPEEFVDELYRLTDNGDPLLLTLWLPQIWDRRSQIADRGTPIMRTLRPSFGGFYEQWMEDQQQVWKARQLEIHPDDFEQVMHVLALAQGRMLLADVAAVLGHADSRVKWESAILRAALESGHRLIDGSGKSDGYALVHPRLGQYFREKLSGNPAQLRTVRRAFRTWGADAVAQLNRDELPSDECLRYLVKHYVTEHINAGEEIGVDVLDRYYSPLLQQGWARAWYIHEGAWTGYVDDLRRILQVLRTFNTNSTRHRRAGDLRLAAEVRCVLLETTIRALTVRLPVQLVVLLVEEGVWSIARAERVALQYEPERQAESLAKLARVASERQRQEEARALLTKCLQATVRIENDRLRAEALCAVATRLGGDRTLLQQALQAAGQIGNSWRRAQALSALAVQLGGDRALLEEALGAAEQIKYGYSRTQALSAVAAQLPAESKQPVLEQALLAAGQIVNDWWRAEALSVVAAQLPEGSKRPVLERALQAAGEIRDEESRARALSAVAAQLPEESKQPVLERALQAAGEIRDEESCARTLSAVAAQLSQESKHRELKRALQAAGQIRDEESCARALSVVVAQLGGYRGLLAQALRAADRIQDNRWRARALSAVAAQLPEESKRPVLRDALQGAGQIENGLARAQALSTVAAQLPEGSRRPVLEQALLAAGQIQDEQPRARALSAVAMLLPEGSQRPVLEQALLAAERIQDAESRARTLGEVAGLFPEGSQRPVLEQALLAAAEIQYDEQRAEALTALVVELGGDRALLEQALLAAGEIQDAESRARTLIAVAARLPEGSKRPALEQALLAAAEVKYDDWPHDNVLRVVTAQLGGDRALLEKALLAAWQLEHEWRRDEVLSMVAAQLGGDHALLERALQVVGNIESGWWRAEALSAVAAQLPEGSKPPVLERALLAAGQIVNAWWRSRALSAVAAQLPEGSKRPVLEQALQLTEQLPEVSKHLVRKRARLAPDQIENEWGRAPALSAVAAQLGGDHALLERALQAAGQIGDERERAQVLSTVAAQLGGDRVLLEQAQQVAGQIQDRRARIEALSAVAAQSSEGSKRALLEQALQAAGEIQDGHARIEALSAVAAQLPERSKRPALEQALQAAGQFEDERARASALSAVAAQLPEQLALRQLGIQLALKLSTPSRIHICALLTRSPLALLNYDLWSDWLTTSFPTRRTLLEVVEDLARSAVRLTGRIEEAEKISAAVNEICTWWP